MLKSLERAVRTVEQRLILLAPDASIPAGLTRIQFDPVRHQRLVQSMQKMRGNIYLHDGALRRGQLSADGLHKTPEDERSWHLLTVNSRDEVTGCAWYLQHANTVTADQLRVRNCPLATTEEWRSSLWKAIASDVALARSNKLAYAEVGGWAVSEQSRCTSGGLLLALAGYSLGRICGGAIGITTATVRHCSSTILRRIGGTRLEIDGATIPPYYDPRYDCEMELLRFDSRRPDAKFADLIDLLCEKLSSVLVIGKPAAMPFPLPRLDMSAWLMARRRQVAAAAVASLAPVVSRHFLR